jgi:hypothetical protein
MCCLPGSDPTCHGAVSPTRCDYSSNGGALGDNRLLQPSRRGGALTEDERAFVGATVHVHDTSGGWRSLQDSAWELDSILSAEDTAAEVG